MLFYNNLIKYTLTWYAKFYFVYIVDILSFFNGVHDRVPELSGKLILKLVLWKKLYCKL